MNQVYHFDHIAAYYEYLASHFVATGFYHDGEDCEWRATAYLKMVELGA